jgi:hypothetical protein
VNLVEFSQILIDFHLTISPTPTSLQAATTTTSQQQLTKNMQLTMGSFENRAAYLPLRNKPYHFVHASATVNCLQSSSFLNKCKTGEVDHSADKNGQPGTPCHYKLQKQAKPMYWYGSVEMDAIFKAINGRLNGFVGKPHFDCMARLLGYAALIFSLVAPLA